MIASAASVVEKPESAAVLTKAVARAAERQTWYLAVSLHEVTLRRPGESLQFAVADWL